MHECKADPHLMDFDISFKASFPLYAKLRTRHHPFPHKINQSINKTCISSQNQYRTSGVMHWQSILLQVCRLGGPRDALTQ